MTVFEVTKTRFVTLLATTTITVYALIATGASLAASSPESCSSWPICAAGAETMLSASFLLVLGHRLLTAVVAVLLGVTLVFAWRTETSLRVRATLAVAAAILPVQVGIGALVVLTDLPFLTQVHLAVAAGLFSALLLALGWSLEHPEKTQAEKPAPSVEVQGTDQSRTINPAHTPDQSHSIDTAHTTDQSQNDSQNQNGSQTESRDQSESQAYTMDQGDSQAYTTSHRERALAYLELTKPRLMWLLCLLALAGMALATTTGVWPDGLTVVATLAGGVLAIGASGTFNHLYERDRDQKMERTANRPVATDQIPARNAALFGLALLGAALVILGLFVNILAAALTLAAVVYYSVIYTVVLKPTTSWNIALGGGAGALPALIGWAAVTGTVGLPAIVLAALVVVWTPAHFYNLAIVYREDYARAGYPMYPVVSGVSAARRRILLMLGVTLLTTAVLAAVTPLGPLFAVSTTLVGALFLGSVVSQCRLRTDRATLRSFHASNAYLGVVLLAIVLEATVLIV